MTRHFFDIGANVGQTFDWLATRPHSYKDHIVWCFEPSPRHFAALIAKANEQAKLGYKIRLCTFGLSGKSQVVPLFEKDDPLGDSLHEWTASDHTPENNTAGYTVMVATRSLASAILQCTAPDDTVVLDIDAEGEEYAMLLNLAAEQEAFRRVRRIMVEFHHVKGRDCAERKKELVTYYAKKGMPLECRGFVP